MSDGLCLGGETQEGTMISNLPLLFADGYPTCLEKITEEQLEKFVPFMIQCSKGQKTSNEDRIPTWWPEELQFSIPLIKPVGLETKWLAILKSLVCRCYTYHGCEFMLRFCTELSQCPTPKLKFVDSWDGTTSLFNKDSGRLLVTFRNENRSYDGKKESLDSLIFQADTETLQPPLFDIYLCESCDGEFRTLKEVRDHERMCNQEQAECVPSLSMEQIKTHQEKFLNYFNLSSSCVNPVTTNKKCDPPRIKRGLSTTLRFSSIPFSSPLGIFVYKNLRTTNISTAVHLERIERHCCRLKDKPLRSRETRHIDDPWPVSWKSSQKKKDDVTQKKKDDATQKSNLACQKKSCGSPKKNCASQKNKDVIQKINDSSEENDDWTHIYKFPKRQWRGSCKDNGLNKNSRRLFSKCQNVQVELKRLTKREIDHYTSKIAFTSQPLFSPLSVDNTFNVNKSVDTNIEIRDHGDDTNSIGKMDSRGVMNPMDIIIPELGPNTLYVYDGRILPVERSPQPLETEIRVPVINLCSSDEEEEECEEMIITNPVECGVLLDTSPDISNDENCVDIAGVEQCGMFNSVLGMAGIENQVINSNFLPAQQNSNFVPAHKLEYRNGLPCLSNLFTPQFVHYFPNNGSEYCNIVNSVTHRTSTNIQSSYTRVPVRLLEDENSHVGSKTATNSVKGCHEEPKRNSGRSGLRNRNFNHESSRSKLCAPHEFSQGGEESTTNINDENPSCREEGLNWNEENMNYHCCTNVEKTPNLHKHRRGL